MDQAQVELYAQKSDIDNNLSDPTVIAKYRLAADIAQDALTKVVARVAAGVKVSELCAFGDEVILSYTSKVYNKNSVEKGIAFPTMISINDCVEFNSPTGDAGDDQVLSVGDVVKIELGAHIDGYIATNGHTVVINANPSAPVEGRAADVICAAYFAAEAALRMIKIGNSNVQVQEAIAEAAALFNCSPVQGTTSSEIKRYVLATDKLILNVPDQENRPVQDFIFNANEAYTLNVLISSGDGYCSEGLQKPNVFCRNVHQNYNLKLKAARAAFNEISTTFGVFPFATRALDTRNRLGVTELATHQLLTPYPMYYTRLSDKVAQFKMTVLVTANGTTRITPALTLPYVHSAYTIPEDSNTARIMRETVKVVKGGKAVSGIEAQGVAAPGEGMDVDM
ncbi:Proliferation-associated protein 2G4 [Lunasporangiospora selenospora]|uniref:Probable metalloprotease ARX1 n=1 Tax=Lunasporangiospora selenospora TaxID=979761 RepID=A0A9P6KBE9_9FUNG|nr:Proliferation-associated protein 2G4 [Lunasporangiospora selenospora]